MNYTVSLSTQNPNGNTLFDEECDLLSDWKQETENLK